MKKYLTTAALPIFLMSPIHADTPDPTNWDSIVDAARGQTVYWHAWGGDPRINAFITSVGEDLQARYGVTLEHVRLADTADAVTRVISERQAGRDSGGAVDVIWINGANFASMKDQGLLFGPFAEALPNWPLVDTDANPAILVDFTLPVEGFGSPWAMFQMVFEYDSATLPEPPRSLDALRAWIAENPGRFTYPQPPDFLGTSFLKQALYGVLDDPSVLMGSAEDVDYDDVTAPLWAFLDEITPNLWRQGRAYPANEPALGQLLADGEIDIAFAFNPGRASGAIADGELQDTVRTFVFEEGTLANSSYLSIPYNASNTEGALVLANLILDPEIQARAQDPDVLGFQTVLGLHLLEEADRARFDALDLGIATLAPDQMGTGLQEPHPTWMTRIAEDWVARYGTGQ
ncbi:putative thiamine transport system substrate-binding protein [Roseinatronobacter bogoriensis subsp. barguzinensis]|uniref:ABC transporter substrate-binding protein n=2 Tax=Roseinatronobacter bogoriensis TaxID=119542 RepID=A0A2K8KCD3_9RHOB|nr:ABC transporter substrate-binding protein [Rhodobaca barguzinensis]MBB4207815.1 putative thiamine transport system substrate-binding protein [Rhodobaca bogoriensis DSM 18756]TDW39879.1 putative thiamine transport system substrate-binding protein [Rhodobaca barguzinensis]TDY70968.1 putative thiamine transport system substrate-binding protein [Rhodobaca bogoriensis DSM 18756]